ncbi:hypothetical protein TCAL_11411 [Tigriopus californicus]|uniref:Rab-like protein 3 n=1 Tax=Tigriopus californicus TaxID=6832 RepID=A0A553NDZ9_TIGCA|nr:rab-like protein 3 [Tigriopus californicus]TRY63651.1 hypothetical protein TCAL_11411 [Tigriopus californicus]|eukprot:TCALIF_11411-PA protein Name:"Similar to Rabl3 Rab-like protein 3 (Mus musculus)" AED:0.05 eAED:0.05 QI:147/1/1/1/1/0.6/5/984/225
MSTTTLDRVRILVLGDSGVGKSSLVHLMAYGQPLQQISYTIGAAIEVKLHEYKEGTPTQRTFWIEFCDVGGTHAHRNVRHVFYANTHGIILVHDLSNKKSQGNLTNWLREFMDRESGNAKLRESTWEDQSGSSDHLDTIDVNIPLLVVGTKQDVASETHALPLHQKRSFIAEEYLTEEIQLNCQDERSVMAGSSASNKLCRFFDKVIDKQFYRRDVKAASERRRL